MRNETCTHYRSASEFLDYTVHGSLARELYLALSNHILAACTLSKMRREALSFLLLKVSPLIRLARRLQVRAKRDHLVCLAQCRLTPFPCSLSLTKSPPFSRLGHLRVSPETRVQTLSRTP